ncbi:sodium/glutamate symporter [Sporosarcina sp. FA9]|uniref:sodium/glutamate symporter n=1 Tax=Sporosarcina sp. FA9 TaxID=3413030 RepID=UPI003F6595AE
MDLLIAFSALSGFLLVGTILRARLKILQSLFLPASVIGGFVGLLLGPVILGNYAILPIPGDWITIYALLPGILIIPVVASVPFGVKFKSRLEKKKEQALISAGVKKKEKSNASRNIIIMFAILVIISQGQNVIGLSLNFILSKLGMISDVYATFGTEVAAGFSGGHGTAGVVGSLLQSMNLPYWNTAQGVTVTTATVGLIGGILIGIVMINFAARRGHTRFLSGPGSFPQEMKQGYQSDVEKQQTFGKETTLGSSIDTLAFHLALILGGSGIAYALLMLVKKLNVPIVGSIPIWAYAIIVMYIIWWIMCQLNLGWIVDRQTTSKISSMFTDFAVVAAIVSMPVKAVLTYIVPITIMMIAVAGFTLMASYWLCKKYYGDFWFERSVAVFGTNTGVFITGLMLLKMVDPEYKSPALTDYSVGYSINSVLAFIMFPLTFGILVNQGIGAGLALVTGVVVAAIILLVIVDKANPKSTIQSDEELKA